MAPRPAAHPAANAETARPPKAAAADNPARKTARRSTRKPAHDGTDSRETARLSDRINNNTLAIIAGELDSTDLTIVHELSAVLDDGDNLRILPMVGAGGDRNIRDVRFMKGVDLGVTQSNLLGRMRQSSEIGPIDDKIVYLTKLFNEEMHLVVREDSPVTSIEQLAGRTVNLGEAGSGTRIVARDVFDRLGIAVREVNLTAREATERLRSGDIDASILIGGKPIPALSMLPAGFRLVAVPFAKQLRDDFLPATLSNEDYPALIEPGRRIETLAVGTVLIAYNWPKDSDHYRKIEKFVAAFFPQVARLQAPPHHPKWREVNVAATLPGWARFAAATDWLQQHREVAENPRSQFDQFVAARSSPPASAEEREQLFREFLQWQEVREPR
ncbi:MAG TPA: TAXI family TRAP transporter solute-binding subunit [Xanthobacteraceae bacterium]